MKLKQFQHLDAYFFLLTFENDDIKEADLAALIGHYVALNELSTARIDSEWGCLEFNDGNVDIAPKTLYQFAMG
ncbi:DUF2442 domain-containing protein [Crenothrix polyspora]|uniref:Uncharacterized protein n=1 Tax=Crenothrix polyspora TaxID=360316 RepID=A0A1R4H4K8_9GAMM|nr:DUF2442 domain-containing protein [Crenothrix polyspora]SJM91182.1 conserved hypothetical protein [Crenothrix polyspora]